MADINLKTFRKQLYHCLGNAKDAVLELTDATILSRNPISLAELSLMTYKTLFCLGFSRPLQTRNLIGIDPQLD